MRISHPKIIDWMMGITVFLIPFYIFRFSIFRIPTNVFEVSIVLLFLITIIQNAKFKNQSDNVKIKNDRTFIPLGITRDKLYSLFFILFIASAFMGVWQAGFSREALGILKSWILLPLLLVFSFQLSVCRNKVANDESASAILKLETRTYNLKPVFWGIYASMLVVTVWAIAQKLGWISLLFYQLGDVSFSQYLGENFRAFGPFESPNYLAMFIVPSIFIALGAIKKSKIKSVRQAQDKPQKSKIWKESLFYISFVLPLLALIFSESRAGIIALIGGLSIAGFLALNQKLKTKSQKILLFISSIILCSLFFILIYKFALRPESDAIRFEIYRHSWQLVRDNWLFGIGLGKFQEVFATLNLSESMRLYGLGYALHPHNLYLALWLNFGLLGLISFLGITIITITKLLKSPGCDSLLMVAALSAILLHGLFDTTYFKNDLSAIYWLIIALAFQPLFINSRSNQ